MKSVSFGRVDEHDTHMGGTLTVQGSGRAFLDAGSVSWEPCMGKRACEGSHGWTLAPVEPHECVGAWPLRHQRAHLDTARV